MGKPGQRAKITNTMIIEALHANIGNITGAAEELGCTYANIYQRVNKNKKLQAEVEKARKGFVSFGEHHLMQSCKDGNPQSIKFLLQCKGKPEGWIPDKAPAQGDDLAEALKEVAKRLPV